MTITNQLESTEKRVRLHLCDMRHKSSQSCVCLVTPLGLPHATPKGRCLGGGSYSVVLITCPPYYRVIGRSVYPPFLPGRALE